MITIMDFSPAEIYEKLGYTSDADWQSLYRAGAIREIRVEGDDIPEARRGPAYLSVGNIETRVHITVDGVAPELMQSIMSEVQSGQVHTREVVLALLQQPSA